MQKYCNIVKNKLNMLIHSMEKNVSDFVVNPKRDFVRKSELSFSKTMRFILGMGSQTLGKELMDFYNFDPKMVSVSAVVQRRAKILPAAFQHLFHTFNESFSQTCFFHGYRLYAVDGSDIHIPTIPDDYSTNFSASADSNGCNLIHLNTFYDLMNRRYMDAVLQDRRKENESSALISMLGNIKHDAIIVADRGYESYNNIAHLEAQGIKYVIRVRSNHGIADKFDLPIDTETDFTTDILLTRRKTTAFKSNPEKYRLIRTCVHRRSCTSFRQILPLTASKILAIRQYSCEFFPYHRQNYARKSAHLPYEHKFLVQDRLLISFQKARKMHIR